MNQHCDFIPLKTKKEKVKVWREGHSLLSHTRKRTFMRYVRGEKIFKEELIIFRCRFGDIILYDEYDRHKVNSYLNPLSNQEYCNQCLIKIHNDVLMGITI